MLPAFCIMLLLSVSAFALITANWKVKSGYEVKFTGGRISGLFESLTANIQFDKTHPEQAKISAIIDVNSLATGFFLKTNHAKEALGADEHPAIKFVSTSVSKSGNAYQAAGNLTLKGVTKPEVIRFTFDDKGEEGVFKGLLKVVTKEFGITKNGSPEEVTIELTIPVTKL